MRSLNNLDISGSLTDHPLAEVLVELLTAELDGSLRLSSRDSKSIFYVRGGELLFAVSNQRRHRIFQMLLDAQILSKQQLVEIGDFTNDMVLSKALRERGTVSGNAVDAIHSRQIETILCDGLGWREGTWSFSTLARARGDLSFRIDVRGHLIRFARELSKEVVVRRFKSFKESFGRLSAVPANISLQPAEAFVLSRIETGLVRIEEINEMTGISDSENLQALYALWLGGFLARRGWNAPFSERRVAEINAAKLEIKQQASQIPEPIVADPERSAEPAQPVAEPNPKPASEPKRGISLESYLKQVESADTHYEMLNVPIDATVDRIKQAYFGLAKQFHPDLYYRNTGASEHKRIQNAFTGIAHAYETLRNEESRLRYDYRLRTILDELKRQGKNNVREQTPQKQLTEASEIFDHGFSLLMDEDFEGALPFLTRAVSMAPEVARYHAYYGKVLSADRSQKFKAEAEIQTAIKLEPEDPLYRLILAEFFIDQNLLKRAEGELNRLLSAFPDHKEAQALLDSLR
jgi:tetratricopeptide (TPR) repeat protein